MPLDMPVVQEMVPEESVGKFYAGDSYVVHYTYSSKSSRNHIIYFWLGKRSEAVEQGSAAARAKELSDSLVRRCAARVCALFPLVTDIPCDSGVVGSAAVTCCAGAACVAAPLRRPPLCCWCSAGACRKDTGTGGAGQGATPLLRHFQGPHGGVRGRRPWL